eukprot:Gb_18694 [translate_table: standard]
MLQKNEREKLYGNISKCDFFHERVEYLEHIVSVEGDAVDPKKIQVIKDWKTSTRVHEVRSFLRVSNFYRKFVLNFSKWVAPLTELLKKSRRFKWTNQYQISFYFLKKKLIEAPILTLLDVSIPFIIYTNASGVAIGVVLTQDGKEMASESQKINEVEQRYVIYDQELLAVMYAIKIWKHYLKNNDFEVVTNHKPLSSFSPKGELGSRQYRWAMLFENFRPRMIYKVRKENVVMDALSRMSQVNSVALVEGTLRKEITNAQKVDKWGPTSSVEPWTDSVDGSRSSSVKESKLTTLQKTGPTSSVGGSRPTLMARLLCVPSGSYRPQLIREAHHYKVAGHCRMKKTIAHLHGYFYRSKMQTDVLRHVRACSLCNISKPSNRKLGYQPLLVPKRPWESISMDFLGGLPTTQQGHDYILVVVDRLRKMAVWITCTKIVSIAKLFFTHVWTYFGLSSSIVSDRDGRFLSCFLTYLWELMDTKLKRSTSFHQQTDGQTERVNHMMEDMLRSHAASRKTSWEERIPFVEHNNSKHTSIGMTPFQSMYGYDPLITLDLDIKNFKGETQVSLQILEEMNNELKECKRNIERDQVRDKLYAD